MSACRCRPVSAISPAPSGPPDPLYLASHARCLFGAASGGFRCAADGGGRLTRVCVGLFRAGLMISLLAVINAFAYRAGVCRTPLCDHLATSQAAFTGMAGLYLWQKCPAEQPGNFALLCQPRPGHLVFHVTTPKRFSRALDWFLMALFGLLLTIALIDGIFPTPESFAVANVIVSAGIVALLLVVGVSLFEGDRHARWIALGFLPIIVAALFPLGLNLA